MNATLLNLTGLDPTAKLEKLVGAFNQLANNASLEATTDTDPSPLLTAFQAQLWGEFNWHPLEDGPEQWRMVLQRLSHRARGLAEFMTYDHHRCDELYAAAENVAQAGDIEATKKLFGAFETGMLHHFDMEEKRFFPAFEQATGMTQGPTMVMRMEHRQMIGVIAQMRQAALAEDMGGVVRAGTTLMVLMRQHNIKEEQMLYPMGEMHIGNMENLLREMQAI